jgi:hypothetical protein
MAQFIHLLHTLQGVLGEGEGNLLVNSKGEFISDSDSNFIEVKDPQETTNTTDQSGH